jgi:glycosyltransferase involved in cell wall biosynthesis
MPLGAFVDPLKAHSTTELLKVLCVSLIEPIADPKGRGNVVWSKNMPDVETGFSIIIPCLNEEVAVAEVIKKVRAVMDQLALPYEVIVVDDGSTDQTASMAYDAGANVFCHLKNLGYGAALKTGVRAAHYENIVITDADGTYPVDRLPDIIEELEEADMVVGSRTGQHVKVPLLRRPARWFLRQLASYITGERIPDLNSGLRAFRRQGVLQYFSILSDKFSFTTTITVAMLCDNYLVKYIPVNYYQRVGKSKIVPWDFVNFATLTLRLAMLFNPLKIFMPFAGVLFLLGTGKFLFDIVVAYLQVQEVSFALLTHSIISATAVIFFLSGLQCLLIGMVADGLARKIAQRLPSEYQSRAIKALVTMSYHNGDVVPAAAIPSHKQCLADSWTNELQT